MPHLPGGLFWDHADRLQKADKGGGGIVYFSYDAAGQRARKAWVHDGLVEERIYLGGYEVYRRHTGSITGTVELERKTLHVADDQRRVAMVETKTIDTASGATGVGVSRWRFQLDNHLGSAVVELDAAGNLISYEEYHPYGSTAFHVADGNAEVSAKRYRYTGKERDEETGLYYHGARYYAPWLGRWTAADPLGLSQPGGPDLDLYAYVRGNPIGRRDVTGTDEEDQRLFFSRTPEFRKRAQAGQLRAQRRAPETPRRAAKPRAGGSPPSAGGTDAQQTEATGGQPTTSTVRKGGAQEPPSTAEKVGRALAETAGLLNLSGTGEEGGNKFGIPGGGNPEAEANLFTQISFAVAGIALAVEAIISGVKAAATAVKEFVTSAPFRGLASRIAQSIGRALGIIEEAAPVPKIEPPKPVPAAPTAEAARGAGAAGKELVTVTHFTSAEGAAAISETGALRAGSFVTVPSEVSGLTAPEIESALEIQAGRGAFSTTFQTPASNLVTPFNGPLTSGLRVQFQLVEPVPIGPGAFTPTP